MICTAHNLLKPAAARPLRTAPAPDSPGQGGPIRAHTPIRCCGHHLRGQGRPTKSMRSPRISGRRDDPVVRPKPIVRRPATRPRSGSVRRRRGRGSSRLRCGRTRRRAPAVRRRGDCGSCRRRTSRNPTVSRARCRTLFAHVCIARTFAAWRREPEYYARASPSRSRTVGLIVEHDAT